MDKVRIGYIGAGNFTNHFVYPQLHRHPVELVAVCDLIEEKALRAQRQYGFQRVYTDFHRMCETEKLDAVFCIGGPRMHYEIGKEVLKYGLPLYIQKSPAPSAQQTQEMADLAAQRNIVCHVGFNMRSSTMGLRAKEIIASDEFGKPNMMILRYGLVSGRTVRDAVMDQHCHATDLTRYLIGDIESASAVWGQCPETRAYVVALRFKSGAVGTLNFTSEQIPSKEFIYFEITGQRGHYLTCHDAQLTYRRPEDDIHYTRGFYGIQICLEWYGYIADVANFIDAVRGVAEDRSPIASTVGSMELCEEIYRQLQEQGADE